MQGLRYENISPTDQRIGWLRRVLQTDMSAIQRQQFARFISGRTRLNLTTFRLKVMGAVSSADGAEEDSKLPTASTCFFWLSLPNYSSYEILRDKLIFAVGECVDIDADFRVRDGEEDTNTIAGAGAGGGGGGLDREPRIVTTSTVDPRVGGDDFEDYSHLL
jgi:hypothetical protein